MHNSSFFLSSTFPIYSKDKNVYEKNKYKCFCKKGKKNLTKN